MALRVGLVGFGLGGAVFHAPLIAALPAFDLTAIVTSDPERRAQAERTYPAAAILRTADDLWQRAADLDVVVIASPNRAHVPQAMAALDAGLAVVVDKPLAATADDARRLIADAARRGLLLTVFHNRRWDGDFLTVRKLIDDGALGEVWRFESRFERCARHRGRPGASRAIPLTPAGCSSTSAPISSTRPWRYSAQRIAFTAS
jgi:scyllo-inositol 2-dehydrogenase (NADP+)